MERRRGEHLRAKHLYRRYSTKIASHKFADFYTQGREQAELVLVSHLVLDFNIVLVFHPDSKSIR